MIYYEYTTEGIGTAGEDYIVAVDKNGLIISIPKNPENTDYAAYLEWVAAGNTPEPWQPDAQ